MNLLIYVSETIICSLFVIGRSNQLGSKNEEPSWGNFEKAGVNCCINQRTLNKLREEESVIIIDKHFRIECVNESLVPM